MTNKDLLEEAISTIKADWRESLQRISHSTL
jgi:hypothetical protein